MIAGDDPSFLLEESYEGREGLIRETGTRGLRRFGASVAFGDEPPFLPIDQTGLLDLVVARFSVRITFAVCMTSSSQGPLDLCTIHSR